MKMKKWKGRNEKEEMKREKWKGRIKKGIN